MARPGVKPRLCRSSWRAVASTHPLMIPSTSLREALLAFPSSPPWNLPSFTVESTLFPLHAPALIILCLAKCGSGSGSLWLSPTILFGALNGRLCSLSFWQRRLYRTRQVLSLWHWDHSLLFSRPSMLKFSAEACTVVWAYCWSWQHQQVCHFSSFLLLSDTRHSVHSSIFPFTSISLAKTVFSFPVPSGYNWSPDTRFYWGITRLMSWPDVERYSCPLRFYVVSLLLILVSTLVFSWTGGVLSHLNSLTQRFPWFPPRNSAPSSRSLCSLSSLLQRHCLLLSYYLTRIGRIENPSCSGCWHPSQDTSHLILHCPATGSLRRPLLGDSIYDLWSRPWGVARFLGLDGLPSCPHPFGRGWVTTTDHKTAVYKFAFLHCM